MSTIAELPSLLANGSTDAKIESLEDAMLHIDHIEVEPVHRFSDGLYARELTIPAGHIIIGHRHRHETMNILLRGKIRVMIDGRTRELSAPHVVMSAAGTRKVAYAVEETVWLNVHPNPDNERDLEKLEARYIEKSASFLEYEAEIKALKEAPCPGLR